MSALKILLPYEKEDVDIFFGRKKETEELFEKVRRSRLMLLYGLSGTGKTSLVKCGLGNRFHQTNWYELYVRKGARRFLQSLRERIILEARTPIPPGTPYLAGLDSLYLDHFRPVYIVFDQFEEIFISGRPGEVNEFIDFLHELLASSQLHINVLLVMREEYLAHLDQFEKKIPTILDNRMRLESMSRANTLALIKEICVADGIELQEEELLLETIYDNLKDKKGQVALPYLSVYLARLFKKIAPGKILRYDEVPKKSVLGDVISDYLDEAVQRIAVSEEEKQMIWKVFKALTTLEGTKRTLSINEIVNLVADE